MSFRNNNINKLKDILVSIFNSFDEFWLVSYKSDHLDGLKTLGVFPYNLSLAHTCLDFDIEAVIKIRPPHGSFATYNGLLYDTLNKNIFKHIAQANKDKKRVCIFTQIPCLPLVRYVESMNTQFITVTSSENSKIYLEIENKINLNKIIGDNDAVQKYIIPSVNFTQLPKTYQDCTYKLKKANNGICVQMCISGSGDGTKFIKNQNELDILLRNKEWASTFHNKKVKISTFISNAYTANGSACIVPIDKETCSVYIDPLSKKIVNEVNSGCGNDWTCIWDESVRRQYMQSIVHIGQRIYKLFGYTGIFGVDYIVSTDLNSNEKHLYITEINPRWQGTTLYQTYNAILADRVPLELLHHIVKLGDSKIKNKLTSLVGAQNIYNEYSISQSGCFYLKLNSTVKKTKQCVQGTYRVDFNKQKLIYIQKSKNNDKSTFDKKMQHGLINIKFPNKSANEKGVGPSGVVYGKSDTPVFSNDNPVRTDYCQKILELTSKLLEEGIK